MLPSDFSVPVDEEAGTAADSTEGAVVVSADAVAPRRGGGVGGGGRVRYAGVGQQGGGGAGGRRGGSNSSSSSGSGRKDWKLLTVLILFFATITTTMLMAYVAISYHHSDRGIFVTAPAAQTGSDGVVIRNILTKNVAASPISSTPTTGSSATTDTSSTSNSQVPPKDAAATSTASEVAAKTPRVVVGAVHTIPIKSPPKPLLDVIKELFELGVAHPSELVHKLRTEDPLGVKGADPRAFICPKDTTQRLFDASMVNEARLEAFRADAPGTYVFYQHLRKAGGTGFCSLASDNEGKRRVPPYYCMVDQRGSLGSPPWNNSAYLEDQMAQRGYRVTANEWDVFYSSMFTTLEHAVFATTIRDPIDRIYSQYRFEHLEHRDGRQEGSHMMSAQEYYMSIRGWTMGANYYIKTFAGYPETSKPHPKGGDFYWTYHKYHWRTIDWRMFVDALDNIMRYHLIVVTEWLDNSSPELLSRVLNWTSPPKKVLPHEVQFKRDVNKTSALAKDILPAAEYEFLASDNALDLLFFQCVQVVYMERFRCYA